MELLLEELTPSRFVEILEFCKLESSPELITFFKDIYSPDRARSRPESADPVELHIIHDYTSNTQKWLEQIRQCHRAATVFLVFNTQ